ncbi:MAG TPA: hypothetical protein VNA26_09790 [Chitinophagaceae bacterium]|nr:hypothetical protein [Chitinophagaceae bacterium]
MKYSCVLVAISFLIIACNDGNEKNQKTEASKTKAKTTSTGNTKIKNDIKLESNGINVLQAFLLYDDGTLVPETNETGVGKPVKMRLVIDKGWKEQDGKVSIGASEKIETSEGQVILDEKDLFASMPSINADDAKIITLTANISQLDKLYDYFLVTFRVWDKNGPAQVNGNYKLYIK